MHKRLTLLWALLLGVVFHGFTSVVEAAPGETVGQANDNDSGIVLTNPGAVTPPGPAARPARRPTRPVSSSPGHVVTLLGFGAGADGTPCVSSTTTRRRTPITSDEGKNNGVVMGLGGAYGVPGCTVAPGAAGAPATPASVAEPFLRTIPMPVAAPFIGPDGRSITGLASYLETNGTLVHHVGPQPTELGPLTAVARSRYWVDWGDGTGETGPFDFEGEAYPTGRIWHFYQYTGTYTITLRQTWTADWSLGGDSGTVDGLETQATTTVDVDEIQAVIIR